MTGLPNWHPALVHFPIALFVTAACFDAFFHLSTRQDHRQWVGSATLVLYFLSVVSALVASIAGQLGANRFLENAEPLVAAAIGAHGDSAFLTTVLFVLVTVFRFDCRIRHGRRSASQNKSRDRLSVVAVALVLASLWQTSTRGGRLVYRLGVGISTTEHGRSSPE